MGILTSVSWRRVNSTSFCPLKCTRRLSLILHGMGNKQLLLMTCQIIAITKIDCFRSSFLVLTGAGGGGGEGGGFLVAASQEYPLGPADGAVAPSFLCSTLYLLSATGVSCSLLANTGLEDCYFLPGTLCPPEQ